MRSRPCLHPTWQSLPALRGLLAALAFSVCLLVSTGAARADDLLVLNGDSETLSGSVQYGMVYIDGDLRLAGDTTISASSIYIGPDAAVISCFVAGSGDNGCTAGRSLTLRSSGPLTVATGIDLTGGTGPVQPGGNLTLSGATVAVAGDITTAGGGGAPSGQVSISSSGSLAVGGVYSPGAPVTLNAASAIDVADGIQTQGNNLAIDGSTTQVQSAGRITVHSSGGNVRIGEAINAYGGYAYAAGALAGGNGAPVSISGADVHTGDISAGGGGSAAAGPGSSAPVTITASGTLDALGQLDSSGQSGAAGTGAPGSAITLSAGGPLTVGGVNVSGGQSSGGGSIALAGSTVNADQLNATGGSGSNANTSGGAGGSIRVSAPGGASLGKVIAYGGQSYGGASGQGGSISVVSSVGSIALASAETYGGYQSNGPGAAGGPIVLSAAGNLSVGDDIDANGSSANGSATPPANGGNAGSLSLRAATGTLTLGGNATAQGGGGGYAKTNNALGGTGGAGGQTVVVAHAIGALASLSSAGGSGGEYGDTQGPGGAGGELLAFTNAPIFNSQQLVSTDGGNGNPTGVAGHQQQDSSPGAPTIVQSTGVLSFASQSPDAQRYRVLMSVGGGAPVTALTTSSTSGLRPRAPVCKPVSFTVVAVDDAVGWTSDPSAAVSYLRQPSPSQGCSDAPKLTAAAGFTRSLRTLRRAHWVVDLRVKTNGTGRIEATLRSVPHAVHTRKRRVSRGARTIATVSFNVEGPGSHVLRLTLPAAGRTTGNYTLRVRTTSPDGKGHFETTLRLEIVR